MTKSVVARLNTLLKEENTDLWEMHQNDQMRLREQSHIIAALQATIVDLKKLAECPTCGTVRKDMEEERFAAKLHQVQTGCNGSPHKCGDR